MSSEFWTSLSGLLVSISGMYYAVLVYRRKAPGNPISWAAWAIIGVAMFLTSNGTLGFNAITFNVTNPTIITIIGAWRQFKKAERPSRRELIGGGLGLLAIALWLYAQTIGAPARWILLLSITADFIPLWLVVQRAWEHPKDDKPFAWSLFSFGFAVGAFGLTEYSMFTLALPVYMFICGNAVALPLVVYRIRNRIPIREWL